MATVDTTSVNPSERAAGLWTRIDAGLAWLGDRLNPILVRETRQALKSRQFTLWFVLLLVACWITTIGGVALVGPSIYYISSGGFLLRAYYAVLLLPLTVIVPFGAYRSLAAEQEENTRDLLEVSSLTHWQVVNGKLGSAGLQAMMYMAALAPCIAFTYLLRGVDLTTIALLLTYAVLASIGLSAAGLLLAATNKQRRGQNFLSVLFAGLLFFAFSTLFGLAMGVMSLDPTERAGDGFYWANAAALSLYLTTLAIVYVATAGLSTFASANRSTPLRVALVTQQAVFIAWMAGLMAYQKEPRENLFVVFAIAVVYWFIAGAILTGEPAELSHRVRRRLPDSLVGRALFSWFCPGPGSGYLFAVANLTLMLVLYGVAVSFWNAGGIGLPVEAALRAGALSWAYVVGFLGLGLLTIRMLRRFATLSLLGGFLVQFLLLLGGSGVPLLAQALGSRVRLGNYTLVNAPSPVQSLLSLLDGDLTPTQELVLLGTVFAVAGCLLLINLVLAGREAQERRVSMPQRVIDEELALNPLPAPAATNPWGDLPDSPLPVEGSR